MSIAWCPTLSCGNATSEIRPTISGNAPLAIKAAKITIAQILKDPDTRATWTRSSRSAPPAWDSEDFREGRRAFMEKRKPQFHGR